MAGNREQAIGVRGYLERDGDSIVGVNVSPRITLPLHVLGSAIRIDGEEYHYHPNGGGLLAASSVAGDELYIPWGVTIGPDTHVVSDRGMSGQYYIKGDFSNPNVVSQAIGDAGYMLQEEQEQLGIIGRLEAMERRKGKAALASLEVQPRQV